MIRYNFHATQMQLGCSLSAAQMGVVGEMGNKAISAFNSVEVDVESELGNNANQPAEAEN